MKLKLLCILLIICQLSYEEIALPNVCSNSMVKVSMIV